LDPILQQKRTLGRRIGEIRRNVIRDLLQAETLEEAIKSIIRPGIEEGQVMQRKRMWLEMEGKLKHNIQAYC